MSHTSDFVRDLDTRKDSRPIRLFCGVACIAGCGIVLLSFSAGAHVAALLVAAGLCGIAETRGRCGNSHIGMIAPLQPIDRGLWLRCCLAYSLCGLVTAYLIGVVLAALGSLFNLWSSVYFLGFACLACTVLVVRELGLVRFAAPQCDRQTYKEWAHTFGMVTGAGMWGAHIGLGITTVITYGGIYCIALVAIGLGIGVGEWMLVAFWLGRIVFLWITPQLMNGTTDGVAISFALDHSSQAFRAIAVCGMISILCVLSATLYSNLA